MKSESQRNCGVVEKYGKENTGGKVKSEEEKVLQNILRDRLFFGLLDVYKNTKRNE